MVPSIVLPLAWLPAVLCALLWARSYWRCDVFGWRGDGRVVHVLMSELGGVYLLDDATGGPGYFSVAAGANGRLEEETGTARRWWQPFRTWTWGYGGWIAVMPLWVPTLALAVPPLWLTRRWWRSRRGRGFDVLSSDVANDWKTATSTPGRHAGTLTRFGVSDG